MSKHKKHLPRIARRLGHFVWVQFEESGAMMAGTRIDLDPKSTGDNFSPSPLVREVSAEWSETRETHSSGVILGKAGKAGTS